jgi:hypothetical protein
MGKTYKDTKSYNKKVKYKQREKNRNTKLFITDGENNNEV